MWMDSYVQETLIRDQIAETQRHAARRHLLRLATPARRPDRSGIIVRLVAGLTFLG